MKVYTYIICHKHKKKYMGLMSTKCKNLVTSERNPRIWYDGVGSIKVCDSAFKLFLHILLHNKQHTHPHMHFISNFKTFKKHKHQIVLPGLLCTHEGIKCFLSCLIKHFPVLHGELHKGVKLFTQNLHLLCIMRWWNVLLSFKAISHLINVTSVVQRILVWHLFIQINKF